MNTQALDGKVAVVTGGSSGIGAACVRLLAAEGARVVVGYHQGRERAEALVAELPGRGHVTQALALDDFAGHPVIAQQIERDMGRVDLLVNSAGYTRRIPHGDLDSLDATLFNEILAANAGGPFSITRAFVPALARSGDGLVVSVSSVAAFTGSGSNIAYCAAKAATDTFTMSLARVFGPAVRFLCVSPASVDTGFVPGRSREDVEKKSKQTPLGRVVTPEDVALAVLGCATHMKTATGTRFVIDGGFTL